MLGGIGTGKLINSKGESFKKNKYWIGGLGLLTYEKIYFDEYFATVNKSLEAAFPGNEVSVFDWSDDLTRFLFGVQSDKDPGSVYLFDISDSKTPVRRIASYAPWLSEYQLASTEPFTYMSRDGVKLHGYITLPPTYKAGEKIPFIVHPHGGPAGAVDPGDPDVQCRHGLSRVPAEL